MSCVVSLCGLSTAVECPFVGAIRENCFIGVVLAMSEEGSVEKFFASCAIEKKGKGKDFVVNLSPGKFGLLLVVDNILFNVKVSVDYMLKDNCTVTVNEESLFNCFTTN